MDLFEYQARDLFEKYGLPVLPAAIATTSEQAHEVAKFADGVIVGSAFVKAILEQPDLSKAVAAVVQLSKDFARGVRKD